MNDIKYRILLAEDDINLGIVLKDSLEMVGYTVTLCSNGLEALSHLDFQNFDLCLLDVMMPTMDGFTLAREIRNTNIQIPILFLTAKSMKEDKIKGFEAGADDYICKPFHIDELLHRIKVFIKRGKLIQKSEEKLSLGHAVFFVQKMQLKISEQTISLTPKEAAILCLLYENKGMIVERKSLLMAIWGDDDYFMGRSLDVFISRIRKYLQPVQEVKIRNVHGLGFCLDIID